MRTYHSKLGLIVSSVLNSSKMSDTGKEEISESLSQESEDSSVSFHSLNEKFENLNVGESDFQKPSEFLHESDDKWFDGIDSSENKDDEEIGNECIDKYFIDDEFLKDLEVSLSEEEKSFKKEEASDIKKKGNDKFRQNLFEDAADLYTDALRICPISAEKDRAILYANRAAARSKSDNKEELKGAVKDCDIAIESDSSYLKAILRRANLNQQLDNLDEALRDFKLALALDPTNIESNHALTFLPKQIEEKNEKLKEEMMSKLKDLGNLVLKPFGLSTKNFQMKQDPNSGGYNISFNQNSS